MVKKYFNFYKKDSLIWLLLEFLCLWEQFGLIKIL